MPKCKLVLHHQVKSETISLFIRHEGETISLCSTLGDDKMGLVSPKIIYAVMDTIEVLFGKTMEMDSSFPGKYPDNIYISCEINPEVIPLLGGIQKQR